MTIGRLSSPAFVTGDAPDVFTNHLAKYPEFVALEQLVDIQPLVERDGAPTDIYYPGLAELWVKDGARYGLPKDWDTVAVVYNADMLEAAGIDPAVMDEWTWNPEDGGTFEQIVAQLTLDANGNNGLSPDFDKDNVVQYGFTYGLAHRCRLRPDLVERVYRFDRLDLQQRSVGQQVLL